ncbi:MAG: hypothetical protein Q8P18_30185 [Pseudomonadota bacterium]|nr:hypothetical protein [Pseudomonadota bacterium]
MMLLNALLACTAAPDDLVAPVDDSVDLRLTDADYTLPSADAEVWWGPDVEVRPGADQVFCYFGTYTGPDVGVKTLTTWQNRYGHHLVLMGTTASELDFPDGTVIDCTKTGTLDMTSIEPMVLPTGGYVGGAALAGVSALPDGMAVKMDQDQRWVIQAHYINTSTEAFHAKDVAVLEYLEPEQVETWAAPLAMSHGSFSIPPGETASVTMDCAFEQEWSVLYMLGHMHEWGTAIKLEQITPAETTVVFDVPTWAPEFRDAPPTFHYADGEYVIPADATFRTTCSWFNDTDEPIEFPHEMCVSVGMVYPQTTSVICDY